MNSRTKLNKLMLMLVVMLLFAASAILPGLKPARKLLRLDTARIAQADAEEGEMEEGEAEERERGADYPEGALRFRRLQMQNEKGLIPVDGLQKAKQHVKQMRVARQSSVRPDSWSWMGPGNIGGRIRAIAISPTNPDNMWVGSVGGGIWRSVDGGVSWGPEADFTANLAVSTMVINPVTPSTMYAGTGEGFGNSDALRGAGVFKSTNAGQSWEQLCSTNPATPAPAGCGGAANSAWFYVNRLAISPNGAAILAATSAGIFLSTDAGTTWPQAQSIPPLPQPVASPTLDIDFNPIDSTRAIAGGLKTALFSTNGGQNWAVAAFNPAISSVKANGRVELAYAPGNPLVVYAMVNQNNGALPDGTLTSGDLYRSTNGGQSYTGVKMGLDFLGQQGGYANALWVNPQDSTFVIVGGLSLYRSTDSGASWAQISDGSFNSAHADHHVIVAHPGFNNTNNSRVFFGNDGGIFSTTDIKTVAMRSGWVNNNRLLGITQFYSGAGNPVSGIIIGGAQDNGTVASNASGQYNWIPVTDTAGNGLGDGGFCAADPTDTNYFYGEYIYLTIYRSTNRAASVSDIYSGISDANSESTANFIAPFILDPNDPNTMLAGGASLWRSTNVKAATPTWSRIQMPTGGNDQRISAIVVSPATSNLIVVGHNDGRIFRTFNGSATSPVWTELPTPLPGRMVTRLVIDNTRSTNWIYATFGGFTPDNIFRTTDNGATWTDVTGVGATGLPDVPVRSLVFHPANPNILYAGTEIGIFTSDDAGATWEVPQNGPANVSVEDLFWLGGDLIAVTHGRGMYRASGGVYVDCNYNGTQLGTLDQPFKTIAAARLAAPTFRTIWLKPCNYNEPMIIDQRVEFRSLGGTAKIGTDH